MKPSSCPVCTSCSAQHLHYALQDLAHAVRTKLDDHPRFSAPKRPPHSFTVDHYAGQVTYSSLLMMDKNKDFVIAEHAQLMASSEFEFVRWGCQCPGAASGPAGSWLAAGKLTPHPSLHAFISCDWAFSGSF